MNPEDLLASAFRASRAAIADDGFTHRVQQRVLLLRRRQKLARAVRVTCATATVILAGAVFGFLAAEAGRFLARLGNLFDFAATQIPTQFAALAKLGVPPWMLAFALGAIVIALALRTADRDPPLRF